MAKKSKQEYMIQWQEMIHNDFSNPPKNAREALKLFKKLHDEMQKVRFYSSPENILELLKNPYYLKAAEVFVQEYREKIENGTIEYDIDDYLVLMTIDAYCMINNIEVKTDLKEEEQATIGGSDSMKDYLTEIAQYKLLTPEQEKELAYKIREGDLDAKKLFLSSNLRLVVNIAKRYQGRGLELMDLIQEGNLGLMTALDRYDVTRGFRFSTYATSWIRQGVTRAIADKGRTVRIPVHYSEKISSLKRIHSRLSSELGREPTIEELADEIGLSMKEVKTMYQNMIEPVSMNMKIGEDEDTEFGDFIPREEQSIEDKVIEDNLSSTLRKLFENCRLKPQEIDILVLRFGLNGGKPATLEVTGKRYGITRERVRQIEARALKKIRRSKYIKDFAIYLDDPDARLESLEEIRRKYSEEKSPNKAYFVDYGNTKDNKIEKEIEKMPKLHTIYQYFSDYTKKQIDEMIANLPEEDKELIRRRYGDNLEEPIVSKLSKEETTKFYGGLVPKMRRHLKKSTSITAKDKNPNVEPKKPGRKKTTLLETRVKEETTVEPNDKPKEELKEKVVEQPVEVITPVNEKREVKTTPLLMKEDYEKLLSLVHTKTFTDLLQYVSPKEATIISLRFGFVDGKFFTPESIRDFLGVSQDEIKNATRKVLFLLKDDVDSFIEKVFQATTEESKETNKYLVKKEK